MSDDRLFVSNNPIGRTGYFFNILTLGIIIFVTNFVFMQYILPKTKTETYYNFAYVFMCFLYITYFITFLSLIDRRLYDITGDRNSSKYKSISSLLFFLLLWPMIIIICSFFSIKLPFNAELINSIGIIALLIFVLMIILLGFFKGKITNLTYEEYKKRVRYK